jgi:hypothetical protein
MTSTTIGAVGSSTNTQEPTSAGDKDTGLSTREQSYLTIEDVESTCGEARPITVDRGRWAAGLLWLGAACSVVGMAISLPFGWDATHYLSALQQYPAYISGQMSSSLAYSPLFMIPAVGVARLLPLWLTIVAFVLAYFSGWLVQLRVGMQFATPDERKIFRYVAPVIAFFPGLLINDVIVSGNLAYILYGLMLASAALGWKRERWNWFYVAVLAAACVKVQLLTMLAIPLLCGKRQWMRTMMTGAAGLALYALQFRIWPRAFHVYLNSLKVMSQSRRDFGCGPAGNLARVLQIRGVPYEKPCILFYVAYAVVMFLILLSLSHLYRERRVCFVNWAPVMLLGVVLLNPRILPYDFAAVSLPMALVAWRSLREDGRNSLTPLLIGAGMVLLALNVSVSGIESWATVLPDEFLEMLLMLGIFAAGVRGLLREAEIEPLSSPAYMIESIPESELVSASPGLAVSATLVEGPCPR